MNKKRIILSICILSHVAGLAQSAFENHEKYWYYRYRLVNNFVKIGDCQGCSIPASARGYNDFASLNFGDGNEWGWYIAVLATEYKLLKKNNQDVTETVRELYYPCCPRFIYQEEI